MGEEESSAQSSTLEVVQSANAVTKNEVAAGSATQTQVLIGEKEGAPNFFCGGSSWEREGVCHGTPTRSSTSSTF